MIRGRTLPVRPRESGAYLNANDALFSSSWDQMVALAGHYRLPGIYYDRIATTAVA